VFQGWGGAALYAYRTKAGPPAQAIEGPVDAWNDPCRFGLFPHAALIARRDVQPARERCAVVFPPEAATAVPNPSPWTTPALGLLPERHRVEIAIGRAPALPPLEGAERILRIHRVRRARPEKDLLRRDKGRPAPEACGTISPSSRRYGHGCFGMAWKAACRARLRDGERANLCL